MDKLLLKKEVEILYKELNSKNMEVALTEIIAMKINTLIKNNDSSASNYIGRLFNISSLCENFRLDFYNIKDIPIFFTYIDNILSGYTYRPTTKKEKDSFIVTIKINNSFLLLSKININNSIFLKQSLEQNNIICVSNFLPKVKNDLRRKFLKEMEDRILYNIFTEFQFRKDEITRFQFNNDEIRALLRVYEKNFRSKGFSVEETILNSLKGFIENSTPRMIDKLVANVNISAPNNVTNIEYLYNELLFNMDSLIIGRLNKCIVPAKTQNGNLILIDLLLIKDIIEKREIKKKFINDTLDNLEIAYKSLFREMQDSVYINLNMCLSPYKRILSSIKKAFSNNKPKTFDVFIDGRTIKDCVSFNLVETKIILDHCRYFSHQIYFVNSLGKKFYINALDIKKFLTIKVSYNGVEIYSPSCKITNLISDFKEKIRYIKSSNIYNPKLLSSTGGCKNGNIFI